MTQREIDALMALARGGCSALFDLQKEAVHG
jgi:ribonuclease PH